MPTDLHTFEFSLYNEQVRKLVQMGESHKQLDDGWADQRYVQIQAQNEAMAILKIRRRYPENKGYIYTSIVTFDC